MEIDGSTESHSGQVEVPCPICGSRSFHVSHVVHDRLKKKAFEAGIQPREDSYRIVACSSCGFLYLNPRPSLPESLESYPTEEYDPHRLAGGGVVGFLFRLIRPVTLRWKAARVWENRPSGSLLDVGCGTGEFLVFMKKRGWEATGIERSERAASIARGASCNVLVGDAAEVALPERHFDLVTFWHSLEHLPDLNGALGNVLSATKPGGRVAIAVPNPGSLDSRFYGSRWAAWDAPRHLYHFRYQDLLKLLQPSGLALLKRWPMPLDPFYHSLLSEISWSSGPAALIGAMRGLCIGFLSFLNGVKPDRASSTLYLFRKA